MKRSKASQTNVRFLAGLQLVCLRDAEENRRLARRLRALGAHCHHLPVRRIVACESAGTARALGAALRAPICVFSSPNAVQAAQRSQPLQRYPGVAVAVGAGTAGALRRIGVRQVVYPDRQQTSEGLLGLPLWQQARGAVGLVSAPGGRDLIEPALRARGLRVRRADVYHREPVAPRPAALARLRRLARAIVVISSAEAWDTVATALGRPPPGWMAVVSSARLEQIARSAGFGEVLRAAGPGADALIDCLLDHAKAERFR